MLKQNGLNEVNIQMMEGYSEEGRQSGRFPESNSCDY